MALQAPNVDISAFGQMALDHQGRSGDLMQAAWSRLGQLAQKNAQSEATPETRVASANQDSMYHTLDAWNNGLAPANNRGGSIDELIKDPRELLARTLQAEAGGEGYDGMLAAGSVIMNRTRNGNYGNNVNEVILRPGQFSAWNAVTGYAGGQGAIDMNALNVSSGAYEAADALLNGQYQDPTGGATHYYNPSVANPAWGQAGGGTWTPIGNHLFGFGN